MASNELDQLVADRNLIAHNFWRTFHVDIEGIGRRHDAEPFLTRFISLVDHLLKVVSGLRTRLRIEAALKEGREREITWAKVTSRTCCCCTSGTFIAS